MVMTPLPEGPNSRAIRMLPITPIAITTVSVRKMVKLSRLILLGPESLREMRAIMPGLGSIRLC